jgi:hypothetical protein
MMWVPPYGDGKDMGYGFTDGILTAVALQWWDPGNGVQVGRAGGGNPASYVSHYHPKGVEVYMTVCNMLNGFNWPWAQQTFKDHPDEFIASLVAEVQNYNLDGVDLDYEGGNNTGGDPEFMKDTTELNLFIRKLGAALHDIDKKLAIATFHSPCWNLPNMSQFPAWVGYVDHARLMGYFDDWEENDRELLDEGGCWSLPADHWAVQRPTNYFKYSWKSEWALSCGASNGFLSIGMPAENDAAFSKWAPGTGYSIEHHIQSILDLDSPTGICIWDNELCCGWQSTSVWALLKEIHDIPADSTTGVKRKTTADLYGFAVPKIFKTGNRVVMNIPVAGTYSVLVTDPAGRIISRLDNAALNSGEQNLPVKFGNTMAGGIYMVRVTGAGKTFSQKLVLNR